MHGSERPARGAGHPAGRPEGGRSTRRAPALLLVLLLSVAALALRIPVAGVADLLSPPGRLLPLWPQTLVWSLLGLAWVLFARRSYAHLRARTGTRRVFAAGRRQPDVREDPRTTALALLLFVVALLSAVIIPPLLVGEWTMQPVQIWLGLYGTYGTSVALTTAAWLVFHTGSTAVLVLILALVQALAETRIRRVWVMRTPLGGLVLGIGLGVFDLISGGWADLATAVISCTLLGAVHLLVGRRLGWTLAGAWFLLLLL